MSNKLTVILSQHCGCVPPSEKLKNAALSAEGAMLLVPDQYTVAAESYCLSVLGERLMSNVRIYSFKRLASAVFDENKPPFSFIGTGGKRVLTLKAIDAVKPSFKFFGEKTGIRFAETISEAISELKTYRITPDTLFEQDGKKLRDIASVYAAYEALLSSDRADPDDRLSLLSEEIRSLGLYSSSSVFVDFFKVLNASELEVLYALYDVGADVTVGLMTEKTENSLEYYEPVAAVYRRIERYVTTHGGKVEAITSDAQFPCAYKDGNAVTYKATDATDEMRFIAGEITRLVRDENRRYSDFAIVCRNIEEYTAYIDTVFAAYNIPVYYHRKSDLKSKIPARFLLSLFDIICRGYETRSVFDLLDTAMLNIDASDISDFKMYITVWNVRYNTYKKPFTRSINGFKPVSNDSDDDKKTLEKVEGVRKTVVKLVEGFRETIRDKTVKETAESVYLLLKSLNIESRLNEAAELYARHSKLDLLSENLQVYKLIIKALDELVAAAGDDTTDFAGFRDLFESLFSSYSIATVPPSLDTVLAGNADTVPLVEQKFVFLFGLSEGSFPSAGIARKLINSEERELLKQAGAGLGQTDTDKYLYELFIAHFAFTTAAERVYFSYPAIFGGERLPSVIFSDAELLSQKCDMTPTVFIQNRASAFSAYASKRYAELEKYFAVSEEDVCDSLTPETAIRLFGKNIRLSPTKADSFAYCPYRYFYRYGMKIDLPPRAALNPQNSGTIIHESLEETLKNQDITTLSDDELYAAARSCADEYLKKVFPSNDMSASLKAYFSSLTKKVARILVAFRGEFMQSEFRPCAFELKISENGDIMPVVIDAGDGKVSMTGVVDRVDVYERDGKKYIRIIDYKSGKKSFSLGKLLFGLDIQLIAYLCAVVANYTDAEPAGVMYVNVNSITVSVEYGAGETAEKKLNEERSRTGLLTDDYSILRAMDAELCGKYIPSTKGIKNENYIEAEKFETVFEYVKKVLSDAGERIMHGDTAKKPLKLGSHGSCDYCDLKYSCEHCGDYEPNSLSDIDHTLAEMKQEVEKWQK